MTRLYAYGIAALALLAAFLALYAWGAQGHGKAKTAVAEGRLIATQRDALKTALEGAQRAAVRNQEITIARLATAEAQRLAAERRARNLDRALQSHSDWAAGPVPDRVWDAVFSDSPDAATGPAEPGAAGRLPAARRAGE